MKTKKKVIIICSSKDYGYIKHSLKNYTSG